MRRRTFDRLMVAGGLVVTAMLLVAGVMLTWGSTYISNSVHSQLAAQQIYFPPASAFQNVQAPKAGAFAEITPSMVPSVSQYAGQQMVNGAQAAAYANDFIGVHLNEIGGGMTYAQLSAKSMAQPTNATLASQVDTVFKGTSLRTMLLTSYGFWQMGQIAGDAALAAFILAGIMLALVAIGLYHGRRTTEETLI